ncbi:hypothetical protein [Streptomyces piniterrae]|uniref:hypothetical protein n=1 Tax=Streptomyces piniterrae TaxID=2571125 RepID=UPI001FE8A9BE|nr:hypothetical protein [Streptomyces piniterrae]
MSSAAIPPGPVHHPIKGATALGAGPGHGAHGAPEHRYVLGNALRAVKVFVTAAFSVAILGEYADDDDRPPAHTWRRTPKDPTLPTG